MITGNLQSHFPALLVQAPKHKLLQWSLSSLELMFLSTLIAPTGGKQFISLAAQSPQSIWCYELWKY